jgi:hypothetical protein
MIAVLLAMLFACRDLRAADWVRIPLPDPNKQVFIDTMSLSISGSVRRAWFKFAFPPHSVKGLDQNQNRFVAYTVMRESFDCDRKKAKIDGLQWFYEDGTRDTTVTAAAAPKWSPIGAETMADALLGYICSAAQR